MGSSTSFLQRDDNASLNSSRPILVLMMDLRWEKRWPSLPAPELELLLLITARSTWGSNSCSGLHLGALPSSSSMPHSVMAPAMACSTAAGSSSGNLALRRSHVASFPGDGCSARSAQAASFTPPECLHACDARLYLSSGVGSCAAPLLLGLRALVYSINRGNREKMSPLLSAS